MKNSVITGILLTLIVSLAAILYFWDLGRVPNGVYVDEATVGYNAYSILNTGKDEFGKSFPVAFRFFGAYTPPLSVYLTIPFVKYFGLNAVSIRLLSGFSTLLGIMVVYAFVRNMSIYKNGWTAILTAFFFAVSPWVLFNARLGYEVTLGYVLFGIGSLLLWKGIRIGYVSLWGLFILSSSTYAAHTERYLVPLFLLVVMIFFVNKKFIEENKRGLILAVGLLVLTQVPNVFLLTTKAFWVKNLAIGGVSSFQMLKDFVSQLLTYYSPRELFGISSDINLQHTMPAISLLFSWMIIPFFVGLYELFWLRKKNDGKYLIILLLSAGVPGALSGHFISIQRVLPLIIPLILVIGLGMESLSRRIKPLIFIFVIFFLTLFSLILLWRSYFVFFPAERAGSWNYGYETLVKIAEDNQDTTYVIDNSREGAIYSLFLFYLSHSPKDFQSNFSQDFVKNYYTNPPYNGNYRIANVEVRPLIWEKDIFIEQVLIGDELLMSPEQAEEHFLKKVIEIKDSTGKILLLGYKTNPEKKIEDNKRKMLLKNPSL